ncbi:MAG TPA: amidohydrolase, partial [Anaerolineales bacterium]|nr:amidohydrolase [Anaerolineales bacterium]
IGEYDALPGLSQKCQPTKEPLDDGAPGHGCGHNMLGTGCLAAAVAVQKWLEKTGTPGTVRYYGCPAEEGGGGKVYMARAGLYDDLDAAFNYHPASYNTALKGSCVAVYGLRFRFHGRTAHAAGGPHEGRSALDAVELMNIGVNFLREHVKDSVRMHYIITDGGAAPNIVPDRAEVEYILRAETASYLDEVHERVQKIAEGATLMTGTTVEEFFDSGYSSLMNNHTLADLQYQALEMIGPIEFTEEERAFAQQVNDAFPGTNADYIDAALELYKPPEEIAAILEKYKDKALIDTNIPSFDEEFVMKGATDVGDLSQIVPVSMLTTTCFPTGSPGHSWANVASGRMSIGHKGMMHAAKAMAVAAMDLYTDAGHLQKVRDEFEKKAEPYQCPIPAEIVPPRYEPGD